MADLIKTAIKALETEVFVAAVYSYMAKSLNGDRKFAGDLNRIVEMEKTHIDRRMQQMEAEGVEFRVNQHVGENVAADDLLAEFDAVKVFSKILPLSGLNPNI